MDTKQSKFITLNKSKFTRTNSLITKSADRMLAAFLAIWKTYLNKRCLRNIKAYFSFYYLQWAVRRNKDLHFHVSPRETYNEYNF